MPKKRSSKKTETLKPYYERDGITLYQGRAERILPLLPDATAAAAITDPPYASGGKTLAKKSQDPRIKYCNNGKDLGRPSFTGDHLDQRSYAMWTILWLAELQRIVRESGYMLMFTDWRQLPTATDVCQAGGFVWRGIVSWNKGRGTRSPHSGYFRLQCEYLVWGTKGKCQKRKGVGPFDGCLNVPVRQSDKWHMTGKPTELLLKLVEVVPEGEQVIDPFAGSGTTGVACALSGRKFIGVEFSEEYCAIAARRIDAALDGELLKAA